MDHIDVLRRVANGEAEFCCYTRGDIDGIGHSRVAMGAALRQFRTRSAPRTDPSVQGYRTGLLPSVSASKRGPDCRCIHDTNLSPGAHSEQRPLKAWPALEVGSPRGVSCFTRCARVDVSSNHSIGRGVHYGTDERGKAGQSLSKTSKCSGAQSVEDRERNKRHQVPWDAVPPQTDSGHVIAPFSYCTVCVLSDLRNTGPSRSTRLQS